MRRRRERSMKEDMKAPIRAWLFMLNGRYKGEDYRLKPGKNSIGSSSRCDIVIDEEYLSSHHANINCKVQGDEVIYTIIDLDSANGTYLNDSDEPVSKEELVDNDIIRFGNIDCRFKCT
jgi:pSer/pThr/pTyr-binding forkhead associated (FHA) protein